MLRIVWHRSRQAPCGRLHFWQNSLPNATLLRSCVSEGPAVSIGDNVQSRFLSTSSSQPDRYRSEDPPSSRLYPVYVHQVSKTVLQHLQDRRWEWLIANGLDRGLHLKANGTFVLKFTSSRPGMDSGRIWTSYDSATQQHWLSVYRQKLLARFLLKDASKSPRNTHYRHIVSTETELEIRTAVDKMIEALGGGGTIST